MRRKCLIISILFILSVILPFFTMSINSCADEKKSVTITVNVYSILDNWYDYRDSTESDFTNKELLDQFFTYAFYGSGTNNTNNATPVNWFNEGTGYGDSLNETSLNNATYTISWLNGANVTAKCGSTAISQGDKFTATVGSSQTFTFTFPDSKDVQLIIKSSGTVSDYMYPFEDYLSNVKGCPTAFYTTDGWYRTPATMEQYGPYTKNGLYVFPTETSNAVEISTAEISGTDIKLGPSSTGATDDLTISVYVAGLSTEGGFNIKSNTSNGNVRTYNGSSSTQNVQATSSITASSGALLTDNYVTGTNYEADEVSDNVWIKVQSSVSDMTETIDLVGNFFYGFAILVSILMIIINIVKVAGAPNNPMYRTKIMLQLGSSFVCLALLGAAVLLTKLFLLTCMGG